MKQLRPTVWLVALLLALGPGARLAHGEPMFLSKQYPQCTVVPLFAHRRRPADRLRSVAVTRGAVDVGGLRSADGRFAVW